LLAGSDRRKMGSRSLAEEASMESPSVPRRYLVVANQTLGGEHLIRKIRGCIALGPCSFHVLAPSSHPHEHATWDEDQARAVAHDRLEAALARFRALGAEVDGHVGAASPVDAIHDTIREHRDRPFDEIILSTLPPGASKWLKLDLPHRVERAVNLPVTHLIAEHQPASAGA
jgi:cell pole-organizing protein PopZ